MLVNKHKFLIKKINLSIITESLKIDVLAFSVISKYVMEAFDTNVYINVKLNSRIKFNCLGVI